eukprot:6176316-Pleurochrysis_carterae.AAC.9
MAAAMTERNGSASTTLCVVALRGARGACAQGPRHDAEAATTMPLLPSALLLLAQPASASSETTSTEDRAAEASAGASNGTLAVVRDEEEGKQVHAGEVSYVEIDRLSVEPKREHITQQAEATQKVEMSQAARSTLQQPASTIMSARAARNMASGATELPDDFKCPICFAIMLQPRRLPGCRARHAFCASCIGLWFELQRNARTCPIDRCAQQVSVEQIRGS